MRHQSRQQLKFQALLAERAYFMRHNLTETEQALWRQLAGGALGVAFKRQVPVDRYIVDFLAPARKLVVEVDGGVHAVRRTRDARRDLVLRRLGYRVLRIEAELVRTNITEAVALVVAALRAVI
jgi:very-short-patch-repair endonuclease